MSEYRLWRKAFEEGSTWEERYSAHNDEFARYTSAEEFHVPERTVELSEDRLLIDFGDYSEEQLYGDSQDRVISDIDERYPNNILNSSHLTDRGVTIEFPVEADDTAIQDTVESLVHISPPNMVYNLGENKWETAENVKLEMEKSYQELLTLHGFDPDTMSEKEQTEKISELTDQLPE